MNGSRPHLLHVLLYPEMVAFNPLLQMLGDVVNWVWGKQFCLDAIFDRRRKRSSTIVPILPGEGNGSSFNILRKKRFCGVKVTLRGQQEIHQIAIFVDGPIKVTPLAPDFDVCFVTANRATTRLAEPAQPLLDHWCIGQNPTVD